MMHDAVRCLIVLGVFAVPLACELFARRIESLPTRRARGKPKAYPETCDCHMLSSGCKICRPRDWCAGCDCDPLPYRHQMGWTPDGLYRCADCRAPAASTAIEEPNIDQVAEIITASLFTDFEQFMVGHDDPIRTGE